MSKEDFTKKLPSKYRWKLTAAKRRRQPKTNSHGQFWANEQKMVLGEATFFTGVLRSVHA